MSEEETERFEDEGGAVAAEPDRPEADLVTIIPPFPLAVAVIGAPGSGKAALVEEFAAQSGGLFDGSDDAHRLDVVGGGAAGVERLGLAVGFFGGYREHLMAFFLQLEDELKSRAAGRSVVTSGTVFGNLAHAGAEFEQVVRGTQAAGLVTPEAQVRLQQVQAAVTALTLLAENFRYQFVFRLPLPPAIEVPGQDPSPERRMAERVDAAIDRILGGFGISAQVLDEPTAQERAAEAVATVERIVAEGIQVPRQVAEAIGQPAG
jgi:hypothetical protein